MSKLRPTVLRALAYCYATGELPKGIHVEVWVDARGCLDEVEGSWLKTVKPEWLEQVKAHPLAKAHDYVVSLGFKRDRFASRQTSHYVSYRHHDYSAEALAYRTGGCTIQRINDARPFRQSLDVSQKQVADRLANPCPRTWGA